MQKKNKAFTLIELLVVVAIIAALVGILSVAQRRVRIIAKNLRQKAAFHAGEVSLELYSKDFGNYPDSSALLGTDGTYVTGAQRLAEAFFGRDDQGFHPKSKWHPTLDAAAGPPSPGADLYDITVTSKERKIPYFERERVGFHAVFDLWNGSMGSSSVYPGVSSASAGDNKTMVSPLFTDVFEQNKVVINGENEKVGMPVLYFRADPTKKFRTVNPAVQSEYTKWVYNFEDNLPVLQLPWLRDPTVETDGMNFLDGKRGHYKDPQDPTKPHAQFFYEKLTQRQDGNFYKPHNKNTFLLISAGYDGIYGTKDDLTNFDR